LILGITGGIGYFRY